MDKLSTILVEPQCIAIISKSGDIGESSFMLYFVFGLYILILYLEIKVNCDQQLSKIGIELEPIQLSIFSHRFMSIAEQMGR